MASASFDTPLYNSRIFDCYLKLVKKRYPQVDILTLLRHAGMKECEVADQGHWFTQRHVDLFYEKLVQLSGNSRIAREAGRYAASPDALGVMREFLLGLVGPEHLFMIINRVAANLSRSTHYSSRVVGPREIELVVSFEEGVTESPCQCENRVGYLEAIFLIFNRDYPEIEHTECIFKGGAVCRYLIRWRPFRISRLVLVQRFAFILVTSLAAAICWLGASPIWGTLFVVALVFHLVLGFLFQKSERKTLLSSLESMRNSSEQLLAQVQANYDSALMINQIGEVISRKTELDDILSSVNQALLKRLNYGRGIILLANSARSALVLRSSFGFTADEERAFKEMEFPLDAGRQGVLTGCFLRKEPILAKALSEVESLSLPELYTFFAALGVNSFICAPIICEGEALGVLAVDDHRRKTELLQSDLNLVQGVAPLIGIAIRNATRLATERDLADELRKASEELERRVRERTAELSRAHEELELLYDSVSHDLRTPLRVIYGYGELLQDCYSDVLGEDGKSYLESMIKGGEDMEATLDRMMDFSEVRLIEPKAQMVDLSALAVRIMLNLRVTDKGRVASASIQEGVLVNGDEALLKSVMENLLGNAWKYTAGKPTTEISFGIRDGVCFVSDNGAGFDMALSDQLFKPFKRLHDRRSFPGHGLGLALVGRIVERLGGRIWAEGEIGRGATFYFTLPGLSAELGKEE